VTTHVYTPTRPHRSRVPFPTASHSRLRGLAFPPFAILSPSLFLSSLLVPPPSTLRETLRLTRPRSRSLYTPSAYIGHKRRATLAIGENETEDHGRRGLRERRGGWTVVRSSGEWGARRERGGDATEGGRRNAGIGEAVTMTTVTGEVLVRIRDHAYVTTP